MPFSTPVNLLLRQQQLQHARQIAEQSFAFSAPAAGESATLMSPRAWDLVKP
jgi:hypothetical protein